MFHRAKPSSPIFPAVVSFREAPAKTWVREDGDIAVGRTVLEHCQIVGEVARVLAEQFPPSVSELLFPAGSHFCSACHDIGKVSPTFVAKILRAVNANVHSSYPQLHGIDPSIESNWGGHAGVSEVSARAMGADGYVPGILGQHHGFSPQVGIYRADSEVFGGAPWQRERVELVEALKESLVSDWPKIQSHAQSRAIAGLTSVADWIGSGRFFENPNLDWRASIGDAIDDAGFVRPRIRSGLTFTELFGFAPRSVQERLIAVVDRPGVYVLEAPMGVGKTEAALFAAYTRIANGDATGIYFALPTQLTSNKMFERFNLFLKAILEPECRHRQALLLHGSAWLVETEMGEDGKPGGSWFNSSKRGLLAPFAVGTIDQALMAAMNVKHGFVRAFGLAGKVVILDEVHTYDAYTGTILDALVSLLCELQCTVIILSATLNHERRQMLVGHTLRSNAYPLITAVPTLAAPLELPIEPDAGQIVEIRMRPDEDNAIDEALARAEAGQQVLWIENTVAAAQQRFLDFAARCAQLGVGCGLLHSRYTQEDRRCNEDRWVNIFGKSGWQMRRAQGRILVGSQVLEQSLDIDADFLVTRFAPTDMLLQRMGRLWRHEGTPRPDDAKPEAWILAPLLEAAIADPRTHFGPTAFVYNPYVLCRSLEVWGSIESLVLPADIRRLVEDTYRDREEVGQMTRWCYELEHGDRLRWQGRLALANLARIGLSTQGKTLPENKAQTRYSDSENAELLLVRKVTMRANERTTSLVLLNGESVDLPWAAHRLNKRQWRELSAVLMRQVVLCRVEQAPQSVPKHTLEKLGLHHCFYLGKHEDEEALLRIAVVDESGILKGLALESAHANLSFNYRPDIGLRIEKNKD